jgi:hypothetical protein
MLIVVGKMAYVRDFLPDMTVMTLMTVIYGAILGGGGISSIAASSLQAPIRETRLTLCAKMVITQI